jgi:hypothetical protein
MFTCRDESTQEHKLQTVRVEHDAVNIPDTKPLLYRDKCFFGRRSDEARAYY